MKINKQVKYIAMTIFLFITLLLFFNNGVVEARTNADYIYESSSLTVDVDSIEIDNPILKLVIQCIYALAAIVEYFVKLAFGALVGSSEFPWADRVVFNTYPALDVNFISSAKGSIFRDLNGNATSIGNAVMNMYYIIYTITIALFSITVGIMALKLAFAAVAKEIADYKQQMARLIIAILLIFLAHYLISFVLYVNEKATEMASSILLDTLGKTSGESVDAFSSIGDYYRESVYDDEGELNPVSAILYAVLIVQSAMILISYVKRFFYILVMALMLPLVVVYDFFESKKG